MSKKKVRDTKTGDEAAIAKRAGKAVVTRGDRVVGNSQSTARPVRHNAPADVGLDDDVDVDEEEVEVDPRPRPSIKVRAIRDGYYDDKRRRVGDVFKIREPYTANVANRDEAEKVVTVNEFSKKWMRKVSGRTPERITTGRTVLQQHHDNEQRARLGIQTDVENPAGSEGVID